MSEAAILCVDDEKVILDSLKRQLRRRFGSKYVYEVAESADEAWEVMEELVDDGVQVVVIVSDWLMPGMKGDEFLIRVHEHFPGIVKILLTGQASADAVERAHQQANLHRYLQKPWNEEELVDAIATGLDPS
ncbi:MAG: response regulator [Chloroflexaceae bacterium]|nr:response regulator [Chloroflexaceae bacterium]